MATRETQEDETQASMTQQQEDEKLTNEYESKSSTSKRNISVDRTQQETLRDNDELSQTMETQQQSPIITCSTQSISAHPSNALATTAYESAEQIEMSDEEEKPAVSGVIDKNKQIQSKYKFLPMAFLGGRDDEEAPVVKDSTGKKSKSRQQRRHTKKCKAYNRYKYFPDSDSSGRRIRHSDKKFLVKVEEYKKKKLITDCRCEEKRCSCLDGLFYNLNRVFRFIFRLFFLLCCPPCPSFFFHKVAFWPPPRDYFFFCNDDPTKKKAEAVRTANVKLRKADRKAISFNDNHWRFGFEHECFSEIPGIDCFVVETKRGNFLGCVFIKSQHSNPLYTLLFSHPNGSDISDHLTGIPSLQDTATFLNCNIVAYDYSGYGISSGRPNENNINADIEAVYDHMCEVMKISEDSIILWGFSIGTAPTVNLSSKLDDIAGVILFAPPTSIMRVLCWKRCCCCQRNQPCNAPNKTCWMDKFNTIGRVNKISAPLLIIHGIDDEMVPIEHGLALYKHSKTKIEPLWVPSVGHNNLENSELLWCRVRDFIKKEANPALKTATDELDYLRLRVRKTKRKHKRKSKQSLSKAKQTENREKSSANGSEKKRKSQQSASKVKTISQPNKSSANGSDKKHEKQKGKLAKSSSK